MNKDILVKDALKMAGLIPFLQTQINTQLDLKEGPKSREYIRTPFDVLRDMGMVDPEKYISEYIKICENKSTLRFAEREAVMFIVNKSLIAYVGSLD